MYVSHFHLHQSTLLLLLVGLGPLRASKRRKMTDWGPILVAVVLFILLTPGLLFQAPGTERVVEFGNFQTSGVSILVHSLIFFGCLCILLIALDVHIYVG